MGVLNVTPDSFSDGGRYADLDAAVAHGVALHRDGRATWSTSAASRPVRAPTGSTRATEVGPGAAGDPRARRAPACR